MVDNDKTSHTLIVKSYSNRPSNYVDDRITVVIVICCIIKDHCGL